MPTLDILRLPLTLPSSCRMKNFSEPLATTYTSVRMPPTRMKCVSDFQPSGCFPELSVKPAILIRMTFAVHFLMMGFALRFLETWK